MYNQKYNMLVQFVTLSSIVAVVLDSRSVASCPDGWTQVHNQCYRNGGREMDFYSAERFCRVTLAAHLPILKERKVAKLYYNLLLFHSSPYDTWLGAIPLKQLNNSWKWLDGSDILHPDMKERFLVDTDWRFSDDEPNITVNTSYRDAISSIAAYHYYENLHCTLLILARESENGNFTPKFDFTRCDKLSHFYCQKGAEVIATKKTADHRMISHYRSSTFLNLAVIVLIMAVVCLLLLGFCTNSSRTSTDATAFYSHQ